MAIHRMTNRTNRTVGSQRQRVRECEPECLLRLLCITTIGPQSSNVAFLRNPKLCQIEVVCPACSRGKPFGYCDATSHANIVGGKGVDNW